MTNRIRELRLAAGMSQKDLANIMKVGQTTVSSWETGKNEVDFASLIMFNTCLQLIPPDSSLDFQRLPQKSPGINQDKTDAVTNNSLSKKENFFP